MSDTNKPKKQPTPDKKDKDIEYIFDEKGAKTRKNAWEKPPKRN